MDILERALIYNSEVSIICVSARDIVNRAIESHGLSATPAAALGRLMIAAVMMTEELKNEDDSLTITVNGGGSVGNIVVSADRGGFVRGYVDNPLAEAELNDMGKLNVKAIVGTDGSLTVIKSDGKNKPYIGKVELISGEIAEDISYYYMISEQKATAVSLGVKIAPDGTCQSAGGALVHVLPFASEESIRGAEECVANLSNISDILAKFSPREFIESVFSDGVKFLEHRKPEFKCRCSNQTIEKVLASLPQSDAEELLREYGKIEVGCQFCGKKYEFFEDDIKNRK